MNEITVRRILKERLLVVEERLAAACQRTGRSRRDVTLVAVTKTISAEIAAILPELGVLDLGENRPQELWHKVEIVGPGVRWHMIGHLQSNKIERTLPLVHLVHSVDSIRLLKALDAGNNPAPHGPRLAVLLQFNSSGEASKQGFDPGDVHEIAAVLQHLSHVHVQGLMTMAARQDPEACRPSFSLLRRLRDDLRGRVSDAHSFEHLSMGMSNDFEVAIEEGATMVRLGTVLFDGVK